MRHRCLMVASTGGHLAQLTRLSGRWSDTFTDVEYATFDDQQSRSLLSGNIVHFVERIPPRGARQAMRVAPVAEKILRDGGFTDVVSTGSAIAVPFLGAARLHGIRSHYIESAARSEGPSLSGKIVARMPGVHLYTQYPGWADMKWQHRGSVFDSFAAQPAEVAKPLADRVVVTLGTMKDYPFRRAVEAVHRVLGEIAAPDVEVLWQVGDTPVDHLGVVGHELIPAAEMTSAINDADVVFAHAGIGSCLQILDSGRVPVLLPRRSERGEHVDDHQMLIARELAARSLAISRDPDELTAADARSAMACRAVSTKVPRPFSLAS